MIGLFSPIAAKIGIGASALLGVALVATVLIKNAQISNLKEDLRAEIADNAALELSVAQLNTNVATLKGGLATCNASVEKTASVAASVAKAGAIAVAEVKKASQQ